MKPPINRQSVILLIGRGFNAVTTVQWIDQLYQAGYKPLVVTSTGIKGSYQGLIVHPHLLAAHIQPSQPVRLMVIPGTAESARDVMANEQLLTWLESTLITWNYVAVMQSAVPIVINKLTRIPNIQFAIRLLTQGAAPPSIFIQSVIQKLPPPLPSIDNWQLTHDN